MKLFVTYGHWFSIVSFSKLLTDWFFPTLSTFSSSFVSGKLFVFGKRGKNVYFIIHWETQLLQTHYWCLFIDFIE